MSDNYTVDLYFDTPLNEGQRKKVEERLNRVYFKDSIDEDHVSLADFQEEDEEMKNLIPDFETAFQRFNNSNPIICEWSEDFREATVFFSGWECCKDAVKKEARKIMREQI